MNWYGIFSYAFNAVAPILILVLIGYMLKVKKVFPETFFKQTNRFAFNYCFAPMAFLNIYSLDSLSDIGLNFYIVLMGAILIITAVSFVLSNIFTDRKERKGVLIQAGFRSNFAIIGLPLVEGLVGVEALSVAAAAQAPTIFYFNIVSVLFLAIYSKKPHFDLKSIMMSIVRNPLIQGIVAGLLCLFIRSLIPTESSGMPIFTIRHNLKWIYTSLNYLSRIGTPLCLIALGGQFEISDVPAFKKELIAGTIMRLIMAPAIGFSVVFIAHHYGYLELNATYMGVFIAAFGAPIAVSSAAMASEMEADETLAGQIVVWTCIFSMFTVFTMAVVFRALGMI